jgi:Uncharacterized protein conserved in bacteria with the myosin-like domain
MAKKDDKKILETARARFKKCVEADRENRRLAVDDLKFLHEPGEQWDTATKAERGNRPCYEFNKLRISVKRVINDIRANRPQGKVRAVEDGDKTTSSVMEGLARNVWNVSDGDAAVDTAAEYVVGGGMGAWRVLTKYSTDDAWEQEIAIEPLRNPFALWADPSARDPMKRDAEYWFLESRMSKDAYESKYGKVPEVEWEASEFDDDEEWEDDDRVRVCEYWYKKPVAKTLALLSDGSTIDASQPASALIKQDENGQPVQLEVVRTRQVQASQICMAIISGSKILEGPTEWAGTKFPFVQVYGEYVVIDGKVKWWGLTRHAKDSQRLHNAMLTNAVETAALAPQQKWWATAAQALGHTDKWAQAHKENLPFLLYNADAAAGGPPIQMNGAQVPSAFVNLAMFTSEEIKATTGIFDAALGNKSNEQTGIAIRARQAQGEIANFNFSDNIARGIRYTWELLLDLIPKIYDTQRTVRVIGSDGAEDYAKINATDAQGNVLNDLSRGKYDVTVTVGPSFSTQRQEAAEIYMGLAQANPMVMGVAGDLIFKSLDLPYAEDMAERMQAMLPPPIQQMLQQKSQASGKQLPPEAMAALGQAQQMMEMVQQQAQLVQQAAQEAEQMKGEAEKAQSALKVEAANIQTQAAQLQADYQKIVADITKREAEIEVRIAQAQSDQERQNAQSEAEKAKGDASQAVKQIQAQADRFIQKTYEMLSREKSPD